MDEKPSTQEQDRTYAETFVGGLWVLGSGTPAHGSTLTAEDYAARGREHFPRQVEALYNYLQAVRGQPPTPKEQTSLPPEGTPWMLPEIS